MIVRIRGQEYPSVPAAAEAHGVSPAAVYSALARGRPDVIGLGPRFTRRGPPPLRRPFTFAGRTWPSKLALAEYVGRAHSTIRFWLQTDEGRQTLLRLIMEKDLT